MNMNHGQGLGFLMFGTVVNKRFLVKTCAILGGSGTTIVTFVLGVNAVTNQMDELQNSTELLAVAADDF